MCVSSASTYCLTLEMAGCIYMDVRLVDGDTGLEGRVEVCIDGVWGAIRSSSSRVARVICNQLGYPSECEHVTKINVYTLTI